MSGLWWVQLMWLIADQRVLFSVLSSYTLPVLTEKTTSLRTSEVCHLCVSSSSWAGSRGSCGDVKDLLLLQHEDPPQWFHCGEEKWHKIKAYFFYLFCKDYTFTVWKNRSPRCLTLIKAWPRRIEDSSVHLSWHDAASILKKLSSHQLIYMPSGQWQNYSVHE